MTRIIKSIRILINDGPCELIQAISGLILGKLADSEYVQNYVSQQCLYREAVQSQSNIFIEFGEPEKLCFKTPVCENNPPDSISSLVGSYQIEPPFICQFNDARLVGDDAISIVEKNNKKKFILENSNAGIKRLTNSLAGLKSNNICDNYSKDNPQIEHAISLAGPWCSSYYHWFAEYLPRLAAVESYKQIVGTDPKIIYPPDPPEYILNSLSLIGYKPDELIEWHGQQCRVSRLAVPSVRRMPWVNDPQYSPNLYSKKGWQWVRQAITSEVQEAKNSPDKIYISREDATERRVYNDSEIAEVLSQYNFQSVILSNLTLKDQVSLFKGASFIIAPHGAGLTNMLWSTDLKVVELFGSKTVTCYFQMANNLQHDYGLVNGKQIKNDIHIPPEILRETIEQINDT